MMINKIITLMWLLLKLSINKAILKLRIKSLKIIINYIKIIETQGKLLSVKNKIYCQGQAVLWLITLFYRHPQYANKIQ